MKKLHKLAVALLALIAVPILAYAADAVSGTWASPGGTIKLDVAIGEHPTLPPAVEVVVTEILPAPTAPVTGSGTGGSAPQTCLEYGPVLLDSGHSYRIHNGKHQWHNSAWGNGEWQDMKPVNG